MINALSIDVEDYFQVNAFEQHVHRNEWDAYPMRVEENTCRILDLLDEFSVKATFFVLGWVAERRPGLVREIQRRKHEVACHGYGHELIFKIGPEKFRKDVRKSRLLLEDLTGGKIYGYRAPSYSITGKSLWALDILTEEGFVYDSSIFPISHDVYGIPGGKRFLHRIMTRAGEIDEFPLSTFSLGLGNWRYRLPIAGGGYLRLLPAPLIGKAIQCVNENEREPVVVYFHPWEIDPQQPKIKAGIRSCFRHYHNLERMELKIRYLLENFEFSTMREVLKLNNTRRRGADYGDGNRRKYIRSNFGCDPATQGSFAAGI